MGHFPSSMLSFLYFSLVCGMEDLRFAGFISGLKLLYNQDICFRMKSLIKDTRKYNS